MIILKLKYRNEVNAERYLKLHISTTYLNFLVLAK